MDGHRAKLRILPALPEGRLALCTLAPGRSEVDLRAGHVTPELIRDLAEFLRHLGNAGFLIVDLDRVSDPPVIDVCYELRPVESMPYALFVPRVRGAQFTLLVRDDQMSPDLCAELNRDVLPDVVSALRFAPGMDPARFAR
jgi:hypothetical protein